MKNLMSQFKGTNKNMAGLDVGSNSIKFLELSGTDIASLTVANYAIEPIPKEYVDENGNFTNLEAVSAIIKKCWKKSGSSVKDVVIALPSNDLIIKKATLPELNSESDSQMQIESEMGKYITEDMSISDLAFDYYKVCDNEVNNFEKDLILVASKKDKIDEINVLVEAAGLTPVVLDAEVFSIQNLVKLMKGEEFLEGTYVVADCGANNLRIFVFDKGSMVYSKDAQVGGVNLNYDIMNNLGGTFDEAEKLKFNKEDNETYEMIEKNFINNYVSEFMGILTYFTSATSMVEIDEVILTGGLASIPYLEYAIKSGLLENSEIIVKNDPYVARPLENYGKASKINVNKFMRDEPVLFLATSLALRKYLRQF